MTRDEVELALASMLCYPCTSTPMTAIHGGRDSDLLYRVRDGKIEVAFCTRGMFLDAKWGDDPFEDPELFAWRPALPSDFTT